MKYKFYFYKPYFNLFNNLITKRNHTHNYNPSVTDAFIKYAHWRRRVHIQ